MKTDKINTCIRSENGMLITDKYIPKNLMAEPKDKITKEMLADLLQEALNLLDDFPYEQSLQERRANLNMNAQNLIWEIKNNAPKLLDDDINE